MHLENSLLTAAVLQSDRPARPPAGAGERDLSRTSPHVCDSHAARTRSLSARVADSDCSAEAAGSVPRIADPGRYLEETVRR
jgi:hypothetical protein